MAIALVSNKIKLLYRPSRSNNVQEVVQLFGLQDSELSLS